MARVKENVLINGLSGRLSNIIFKSYRHGTVISKYPDMSKVKRTSSQKKQNSRFQEAVHYARSVPFNPELLKAYEKIAKRSGRTVYHVALADYMNDLTKTLKGVKLAPSARRKSNRKRK